MIELVATVVITLSSVLLFGYWFRYTCLLILSAKTAKDYASQVAAQNQLGFLEVQSQLQADVLALDPLRAALDHDFALLSRMLKESEAAEGSAIENRMLDLNYRLNAMWFRAASSIAPASARKALQEMSMVIAHMANAMGEQAASSAAA
ncbi:MAG: hypothetical protein ABL995_13555 [Bryobacteraceae bacterium]